MGNAIKNSSAAFVVAVTNFNLEYVRYGHDNCSLYAQHKLQ
jgi:hypothetical protein